MFFLQTFHFAAVWDFIGDNEVCNVLNETEIVANSRKARLRGMAINFFGFWIIILANADCLLQSCFSRNRSFGTIAIQSVVSLEIT